MSCKFGFIDCLLCQGKIFMDKLWDHSSEGEMRRTVLAEGRCNSLQCQNGKIVNVFSFLLCMYRATVSY